MSLALTVTNLLMRFRPVSTATPESVLATARRRVPARPNATLRAVADVRVDGRLVHLTPKSGATGAHLLYLHGGCYTYPILSRHWTMLATFVRDAGVSVTVPQYPLAPEHDMHEAYALLDAVHAELPTDRLFIGGDSAGGGLALGFAQRLRDRGAPTPAGLVLISPWLDVRLVHPGIPRAARRDQMLGVAGLRAAGEWWSRGETASPLASPLLGELGGLPPVHVVQGGRDLLTPDVLDFVERAREAGTEVSLDLVKQGFHVFVAVPKLPEAQASLAGIVGVLGS